MDELIYSETRLKKIKSDIVKKPLKTFMIKNQHIYEINNNYSTIIKGMPISQHRN